MSLKQLLCPLKPTVYLVGGLEFGHNWRGIKGEHRIYCKKCFKEIYVPMYESDSVMAKEALDKLLQNKNG